MAALADCVALDVTDHAAVVAFCQSNKVGLVVVGPEIPLVDGMANSLRAAGIAVFGPDKQPARLEGSKIFMKEVCDYAPVPTARYFECQNRAQAMEALDSFTAPYVIKADGLAAGKGVIIAESRADAEAAVDDMLAGSFGAAGAMIVIEEFMEGEEVSFFALTDGKTVVPFGSAQDHKRVGDGDTGPNTGGMGAYSPARVLTPALEAEVMATIIQPTVDYLAAKGIPYSGVLFAGLMLTGSGPKLIEYNCRFGDPECQVLMKRLESDLAEILFACAQGRLAEVEPPRFSPDCALTVVMAAQGYPGTPEKGALLSGLDEAERVGVRVFHAGTALDDAGAVIANGGRVLNVTARGPNVRGARDAAYAAIGAISFPGGFYRNDIGWREIKREG